MKNIIIVLFLLTPIVVFASPQFGDRFIINNDTILLNHYPLESFIEKNKSNPLSIELRKNDISLYTVRGYQATWKIHNDSLFLIDVGVDRKILELGFGKHYKNGVVFAYWFKEKLFIPDGERLNNNPYWNVCKYEIEYLFKKGKLKKRRTYLI